MIKLYFPRKRHNKGCRGGGLFGCKCGDPGTLTIAIMAILAGAATGLELNAMTSTPKAPSLPTTPNMDTAKNTAQDQQSAQRRAALASGGNTNVTGGMGIVLGSDISSVSLVGSS